MKTLKLRCIRRSADHEVSEILAKSVRAKFGLGKVYFADLVTGNPESWETQWQIRHFEMPFILLRDSDSGCYYVPGITGLWFSDKQSPLELRDTRRNSDWDRLKDKRVVRRMYRQMAKRFAGATDLKMARNHKR